MTRCARLILTQREPTVLTRRNATLGQHDTLGHPLGGALLGWAARNYTRFRDPFAVFHSGAVRFSDALPLTREGEVAYPVPELLMYPKDSGPPERDGKLDSEVVRVGRPPASHPAFEKQHESLRGFYVTASLNLFRPSLGARLRTATIDNRAAEGQLFGYNYIKPSDIKPSDQRYVATIEADSLGEEDWELLLSSFDGAAPTLGRARASHGAFECAVDENASEGIWPCSEVSPGSSTVRVWVLTDLALIDELGTPCFTPTPDALGLPFAGRLKPEESSISTRRYSPWNKHLPFGRDVDRQVIQAGSVLTFGEIKWRESERHPRVAGLWREAGLGRIWVDPPILQNERPVAWGRAVIDSARTRAEVPAVAPALHSDALRKWARSVGEDETTETRDRIRDAFVDDFDVLSRSTDHIGPSPSQWNAVATAAKEAADLPELRAILFEGGTPVCGRPDQATRGEDWMKRGRLKGRALRYREWLQESLAVEVLSNLPSMRHKRWVVIELAKHAGRRARGEGAR